MLIVVHGFKDYSDRYTDLAASLVKRGYAVARIRERSNTLEVPLLAMHGSVDKVTPPAGSKDLVEAAASKDKTLKIYEGLAHDLMHEPEKLQVMADLGDWLDARVAAPAAVPSAPATP